MENKEKSADIKISLTDAEFAELNMLATWLDGNATPEEDKAVKALIASDENLQDTVEAFEFMKQYESEFEELFGDDNYRDELEMSETIFTSALRNTAAGGDSEVREIPPTNALEEDNPNMS
jgi:hypothetical protein